MGNDFVPVLLSCTATRTGVSDVEDLLSLKLGCEHALAAIQFL